MQFWDPKNEHHSVSGVYREVVPNRKLAFSWAWQTTPERESLVTIELNPVTDGTMLTLTHEQFFDEKARDDHGRGWNVGARPAGGASSDDPRPGLHRLCRPIPRRWPASCRAC